MQAKYGFAPVAACHDRIDFNKLYHRFLCSVWLNQLTSLSNEIWARIHRAVSLAEGFGMLWKSDRRHVVRRPSCSTQKQLGHALHRISGFRQGLWLRFLKGCRLPDLRAMARES